MEVKLSEKSVTKVLELGFSLVLVFFVLILPIQKVDLSFFSLAGDSLRVIKITSLLLVLISGLLVRFRVRVEVLPVFSLLYFMPFSHHANSYFSHNFFIVEFALAVFLFFLLNISFEQWSKGVFYFFILAAFYVFFDLVRSGVIFGDDLSVFFYRLAIFNQTGHYLNFDPFWNGGRLTTDIIGTGLFFLAPFYKLLSALIDPFAAFNILVLSLYMLFGVATFTICRVYGLSAKFSLIGGFLALVSSEHLFKWNFHFGTLGFLSSLLGVLWFIAFTKAVVNKPILINFLGLATSGAVISSWPFGWIVALPALVQLLSAAKSSIKSLLALLLTSLPSVVVSGFWFFNYLSSSLNLKKSDYLIGMGWFDFIEKNISGINLIVLLLGTLAVRRDRLISNSFFWSLLVIGVLETLGLRGLEPSRFFVFAGCLLAVSASLWLHDQVARISLLSQGVIGGWFFVSALQAVCFLGNFSHLQLVVFEEPLIKRLSEINRFKERIVFFDYTLHQLKGAHLAPLAYFARREFLANYPFHSNWEISPLLDFEKEKRQLKYRLTLQTLGASTVATFTRKWIRKLRQDSGFRRIAVIFPFNFFAVKSGGKSRSTGLKKNFADFNSLSFQALRDGNFYLPYNYFQGLKVVGCEKIDEVNRKILLLGCRRGEVRVIFKSSL